MTLSCPGHGSALTCPVNGMFEFVVLVLNLIMCALVPHRFGLYCHTRQLVVQASSSAETVDSCAIIHYIGLFVYLFVYERLSRQCAGWVVTYDVVGPPQSLVHSIQYTEALVQ